MILSRETGDAFTSTATSPYYEYTNTLSSSNNTYTIAWPGTIISAGGGGGSINGSITWDSFCKSVFSVDEVESVRPFEDGSAIVDLRCGVYTITITLSQKVVQQLLEALGDGFSGNEIGERLETMFENEPDRKEGRSE